MHSAQERIAILILKAVTGNLSPEEEAELASFKNASDANRKIVEKMQDMHSVKQKLQLYSAVNNEEANWELLEGKMNELQPVIIPIVQFYHKNWFRYAAAAVILIAGVAGFELLREKPQAPSSIATWKKTAPVAHDAEPGGNKATLTLGDGSVIVLDSASNGSLAQQGGTKIIKTDAGALSYKAGGANGEILYNTINVPRGGQFQVVLPDGSKAWLNSLSSIRFPTIFTGKERKVEITGEAYFEIAAGKNSPFRVEVAGGSAVEVLGTSFNINAYTDEGMVRTTLLNGSIKVVKASGSAVIRPGEQAQYSADKSIKVTDDIDIRDVMAWKNGEFRFNNLTVEELMRQISRWYDVEIVYDAGLPKVSFFGIMPRQENVSKLLEILSATKQLKFIIENKTIYVKKIK